MEAELTSEVSLEDGHVRVEATANPLYGDGPYTVQTGGCGTQGEAVHVTADYLAELDGAAAERWEEWKHLRASEGMSTMKLGMMSATSYVSAFAKFGLSLSWFYYFTVPCYVFRGTHK